MYSETLFYDASASLVVPYRADLKPVEYGLWQLSVRARAEGLKGMGLICRKKDGTPYLESHHIIWLKDGGADSLENTVALCPNCHRKMHHLNDPKDIEILQKRKQKDLMDSQQL